MRRFTSILDAADPKALIAEALQIKYHPYARSELGKNRCLGLVFLNPSLRTRLSTQRAAQNVGLNTMVTNIDQEGWSLETRDIPMDGSKAEHIKEAAGVLGKYCDILGVRSFARLNSCVEDEEEEVLKGMIRYSGVPVISLESAFRHPLQSLADLMTIKEHARSPQPKICLMWAPHIKPLPQAVANSFAEWVLAAGYSLTIAAPSGYELAPNFTAGATLVSSKAEGLDGADFVYVKNWSKYEPYGQTSGAFENWMITASDLSHFPKALFMHCLPVRRDVELSSAVLDSRRSLVLEQAQNRIYSAQAVLTRVLSGLKNGDPSNS